MFYFIGTSSADRERDRGGWGGGVFQRLRLTAVTNLCPEVSF